MEQSHHQTKIIQNIQQDTNIKSEQTYSEQAFQPPSTQENIDKLTLELLVNKNKYKHYLAKKDKNQYDELLKKQQLYQKYSSSIYHLTKELLQQHTSTTTKTLVGKNIQDAFDIYIQECITHFTHLEELASSENEKHFGYGEEDEIEKEDVMFGNIVDEPFPSPNTQIKTHTIPYYNMNMFMVKR